MIKKYSFWITTAIVLQVLSAMAHSISFFVDPVPANETEKQLLDLMQNYRTDMGMGFAPSTTELFTSLSACFPLLYLFGALVSWYLWYKKADISILKGIGNINILIFGIAFVVFLCLTFPPPIICSGLVLFALIIARLTLNRQHA